MTICRRIEAAYRKLESKYQLPSRANVRKAP